MANPTTLSTALRRVLYISQLLESSLEWLRMDRECPVFVRNDAKNVSNSLKRFKTNLAYVAQRNTGSGDTWKLVQGELANDRLNDLLLHFDVIADIDNLHDITREIEALKQL